MNKWLLAGVVVAAITWPEASARPKGAAAIDAKAVVDAHNRLRAKHCAPPLSWSAKVAASAQR